MVADKLLEGKQIFFRQMLRADALKNIQNLKKKSSWKLLHAQNEQLLHFKYKLKWLYHYGTLFFNLKTLMRSTLASDCDIKGGPEF